MNNKEIVSYCLEALKKSGAEKAQCSLIETAKHEFNIDAGAMSLFRTTFNTSITLTAFLENRKGSTLINKTDKEALDAAVAQAMDFTRSSNPDEANDIAEQQPPTTFDEGDKEPALDKMYERFQEFLTYTKEKYPLLKLDQVIFDFTKTIGVFANTNGVDLSFTDGIYSFGSMFTSKDGEKMSSFSGSGGSHRNLSIPLKDWSGTDQLIKESGEQTVTKQIGEKFTGDIIITPFAMDAFLSYLESGYLSDQSLITKNSPFMDKINTQVASPMLTLHSRPASGEIENGYYFTPDGYVAQNCTIIEKGMLKTYLLSLYGAKKTGLARAVNVGGAHVIDPGKETLSELIRSVKKGVLLGRFSGGRPNDNGDFSGVAKNSYYIENGEIKYPISETMIAGNVGGVFKDITAISSDRINFGSSILPWVKVAGITVSG